MASSIVDHLRSGAMRHPDALAFRYLIDGEETTVELSYGEFFERAAGLARILSGLAAPGDRAILLFSAGLESAIALYACFMAGLVAVPTAAPHLGRIKVQSARLIGVVTDCSPTLILSTSDIVAAKAEFAALAWELAVPRWIAVDVVTETTSKLPLDIDANDLAVLQYTSGSTSKPKGVMLTHGNIVANQLVLSEITSRTDQKGFMSWLPFYHDMGLAMYLHANFIGVPCTLMSPMRFMQRPLRWLRAISNFGCTGTSAPNFALDRVTEHASEQSLQGIDLHNLRAVVVGAEPVRARSLARFCEAIASTGFRSEALFPCFGLAESTVICTVGPRREPVVRTFESASLAAGRVVPLASDVESRGGSVLVGNGAVGHGHELLIVDQAALPVSDCRTGEIWIRGPSIGRGYWGSEEHTETVFGGVLEDAPDRRFLRTGDVGFVHENELFVCGRTKDIIIINGRNIYPEDVEEFVRSASTAIGEGVAAFEAAGNEARIVVLAEAKSRRPEMKDEIVQRIRQTVCGRLDVEIGAIGLLAPLSLPRTSSGKIQRKQAREAYEKDQLQFISGWRGAAAGAH